MKKFIVMMLIGLWCTALFAQSHGARKCIQSHGPRQDNTAPALAVPAYGNIGVSLISNGDFGTYLHPSLTGWTSKNCQIKSTPFSYKNVGVTLYNRTSTNSYITQDITAALNANGGGFYLFEASFPRSEDPDMLKNLHLSVTQNIKYGQGNRTYVFHVYDSYIQTGIAGLNGPALITKVKGLVKLKNGCRYAYVNIQPGATTQDFNIDRISLCKLLPDSTVLMPFPQRIFAGRESDYFAQNNIICIYEQWKRQYLKTSLKDPNSMYLDQTQYYDYDFIEDKNTQDPHSIPGDIFYQWMPTKKGITIATSEGMGYAMLIEVMMAGYDGDARKNFDALLYTVEKFKSILDGTTNPYLMSWVVPENENPANCSDSATDGDLDIAYSLLLAYKQWGDVAYLNKAIRRINEIKSVYVRSGTNSDFNGLLITGNWQEFETFSRPSDWMLDHFRAFKAITGIDFDSTINFIYNAIGGSLNYQSGLLPDFTEGYHVKTVVPADCKTLYYAYNGVNFYTNGTNCEIELKNDGQYFYNSCRFPWRFAVDFSHKRNLKTRDQLVKVMEFFKNIPPDQLNCGYDLNGVPLPVLGDYFNPPENSEINPIEYETGSLAFVAPVAAAYAVYTRNYNMNTYANQSQAYWDYIKNRFENENYSDTINLLCIMTGAGSWWDPGVTDNPRNYPPWELGATYEVGDKVSYNNKVYICLQAHTAYAANWNPEQAPALWKLVK